MAARRVRSSACFASNLHFAIYYFTLETGSNNFRLVTQRPFGIGDIHYLRIQADASDTAAGAEFVVKNFSLRASKIMKEN